MSPETKPVPTTDCVDLRKSSCLRFYPLYSKVVCWSSVIMNDPWVKGSTRDHGRLGVSDQLVLQILKTGDILKKK